MTVKNRVSAKWFTISRRRGFQSCSNFSALSVISLANYECKMRMGELQCNAVLELLKAPAMPFVG